MKARLVNLKVLEKEDLPLLADWSNNPEYYSECAPLPQRSKTEWEKRYDNLTADTKWFFIEKKDGTKIGEIGHFMFGKLLEIYCYLVQRVFRT